MRAEEIELLVCAREMDKKRLVGGDVGRKTDTEHKHLGDPSVGELRPSTIPPQVVQYSKVFFWRITGYQFTGSIRHYNKTLRAFPSII